MSQLRGDRLRKLREERGLTQEELADKLKLHPRQMHRYESGETDPSGEIVARIAKVFDVTTDYLLGLIDDPTRELTEEDLSPMERKLIAAVRAGLIVEALDTFNELAKSENKK